jgi:hypothetical protein
MALVFFLPAIKLVQHLLNYVIVVYIYSLKCGKTIFNKSILHVLGKNKKLKKKNGTHYGGVHNSN